MIWSRHVWETVITRAARRMDQGTVFESTRRSRGENHSGWKAYEMSCTVTTVGHRLHSGAVDVVCSTSRPSRTVRMGRSAANLTHALFPTRRRNRELRTSAGQVEPVR